MNSKPRKRPGADQIQPVTASRWFFIIAPEAPVECALEISRALKKHPELQLANGHTQRTREWGDRRNRKSAQRGWRRHQYRAASHGLRRCRTHFALEHVAEDLEEYPHWQPHLHELGECEVKHGVRISVVNLYTSELGNPTVPEKLRAARVAAAAPKRTALRWLSLGVVSLLAVIAVIGFLLFRYRPPLRSSY